MLVTSRTVVLVPEAERGVLWRRVFRLRHNRHGSRSEHVNERIGSLVSIEGVVATTRSLSSIRGACPTLTLLLRRTIYDRLHRSRPEKILNVFQRIHLRFFQACGLASGRTSFASSRTAMSVRLLVFALLLCTLFPLAQIRWSFDSMCGSTGDTGSAQACEFSDPGVANDSGDDSPQVTPEDCVASRVTVSNCESSRSHASMNEIPPSILLVSRLLHPPTAHS